MHELCWNEGPGKLRLKDELLNIKEGSIVWVSVPQAKPGPIPFVPFFYGCHKTNRLYCLQQIRFKVFTTITPVPTCVSPGCFITLTAEKEKKRRREKNNKPTDTFCVIRAAVAAICSEFLMWRPIAHNAFWPHHNIPGASPRREIEPMWVREEEHYWDSVGLSDLFIVTDTDGDSDSEKLLFWIRVQPTPPSPRTHGNAREHSLFPNVARMRSLVRRR